jgi:hypothetical protein
LQHLASYVSCHYAMAYDIATFAAPKEKKKKFGPM